MQTLTPREAARLLKVHLATVYRLMESGELQTTGESYGAKILRASVKGLHKRACWYCGEEFYAAHGRQSYCSATCRYDAGNERKRQRAG